MAKKSPSTAPQKRKPRLLWANPFCLLDTSSGASMTVRQMLHQLVQHGYEVQVLGCTIFDNPKGMGLLKDQYPDFKNSLHQLIEVEDGDLSHQLVVTARTTRNHLTAHEEGLWHSQYLYLLDSFKPDIVWFYGGQTLDLLIPDEARARGIPSAFYLANGNYKAVRWCRDIDLILTDSQSTADMYRTSKKAGFAATPVGKFIDPANFVAETHERKRLLFVNPSWQKGASVVVQLALALEQKRPDIQLEVVEARADWSAVLRETTKKLGEERASLPNVIVTPNTSDMRDPYSRARVLLAPSLWWESSGRVLAEAMLNGVPALITNRGGMPEMIGDAGIAFDFPEECYEAPHQHLLDVEQLQPLYDAVIDFYDDTALYEEYVQRAWTVGEQRHHIDQATERLTRALAPFVKLRAGNKDFTAAQQKRHRQGLASIASKPTFKVDASLLLQNQKPGRSEKSMPLVRGDFDWQIEGKIIVLDSRAKLLKMGAAENLTKTGAFGIIAFDPASEVSDPKQYEGSETTQVFQHALLGDGNPATLYTCLDAKMSSTLEPLPQEELPEQHQQGSQVLTKLPINTIALDSIEGLPGLDWLILDELSDTATILEHGQQTLKDTLIIQARVAFQPTHKHQPSLAELQHWASRNGFRFYRLNESQHASHLPRDIPEQKRQATELVSADALFLPSAERMKSLSESQRTRLAFLLHTVYNITDITFEILDSENKKRSKKYLDATGLIPQGEQTKVANKKHPISLDSSSLEGANLHIMILEKFTAPFIDFVNENIEDSKNHYVVINKEHFAYGLEPRHGVEFCNTPEDFDRLKGHMRNAEKIIFHGLWMEKSYSILKELPELYRKTYWLLWGGDFHYPEKQSNTKKEVIKNIGFLISPVEGDVKYVREKYSATGKHWSGAYYPAWIKNAEIETKKSRKVKKIMLGNSSFETNNHFEAIKNLSKLGLDDIKIFCPLSYGPKDHANKVREYGVRLLGDNFFPMFNFIPPNAYESFLDEIDIAIYNHTRQQAYTTTLALLDRGAKIYLNPESPVYKKLKNIGIHVFNIKNISLTPLSHEKMIHNQKIINKHASDKTVASFLRSWML